MPMKPKISENNDAFKNIKSYSVDEILAAGGPTAFAEKTGKTFENMLKVMADAPQPEPFTDEEWADLMEQMAKDK
jgi:hypothetical protein